MGDDIDKIEVVVAISRETFRRSGQSKEEFANLVLQEVYRKLVEELGKSSGITLEWL
jgi:hypothetical protein